LLATCLLAVACSRPAAAPPPAGVIRPELARAARAICQAPAAGRNGPATTGQPRIPAAEIRVDQVGYPSNGPKAAQVMTASANPGTLRWALVRRGNCSVVGAGSTAAGLGSWSQHYPAVLAVTFDSVTTPGEYRLGLVGSPHAVSPWFRIGQAPALYARPLANALSFYAGERDGPGFIRSPLRTAPGHLNDARSMTYRTPPVSADARFSGSLAPYATGTVINASGGWSDAGDYLKFAETTSYTVAVMLQGIASFPAQLGPHGQADFTGEARYGLDFLQRLWDEHTRTLYYQVGIAEANSGFAGDHDIWRLPQADDSYGGGSPFYTYIRHPPVLRAAPPGSRISPNLAGRLAADFALCYRVFRGSDPGYAAKCLRSAETVYRLAGTNWKGQLLTVAPFGDYPETAWRDDMMLGAAELSLALRDGGGHLPAGLPVRSPQVFLRDAAGWARSWLASPAATEDTLNLYDVSGLADYELYRAIGLEGGGGLAVGQAALAGHLKAQLDHATGIASQDPFGFGFGWNQSDTAAHGAGLSVMANEYDALTRQPAYGTEAQGWLNAILGANAWGESFIVGDGTAFPHCPSHQVANLAGSLTGKVPVLDGATVEGPNSYASTGAVQGMRPCSADAPGRVPFSDFNGHHAVFADNVQSYSTTEPAIDLTVLTPLAFAWQEAAAASVRPSP
jgi:endoglucanase